MTRAYGSLSAKEVVLRGTHRVVQSTAETRLPTGERTAFFDHKSPSVEVVNHKSPSEFFPVPTSHHVSPSCCSVPPMVQLAAVGPARGRDLDHVTASSENATF